MKKIYTLGILALTIWFVFGCVERVSIKKSDPEAAARKLAAAATVTPESVSVLDHDTTVISVEDSADFSRIKITIVNPRVTPKRNTKGKDLKPAARVMIASSILHAKYQNDMNSIVADVKVEGNEMFFEVVNYAKHVEEPVCEVYYGPSATATDGTIGLLLLDPDDPAVVYKTKVGGYKTKVGDKANLKTLGIGIVMYPNVPTKLMKSLGLGKLKAGRASKHGYDL